MSRPKVTERGFEIAGPAAKHSEHRVQRNFVSTLLKGKLTPLTSLSQAARASESDRLPNGSSGEVVDPGNGIHVRCLEQLPFTDSPAVVEIRKGRRVR